MAIKTSITLITCVGNKFLRDWTKFHDTLILKKKMLPCKTKIKQMTTNDMIIESWVQKKYSYNNVIKQQIEDS